MKPIPYFGIILFRILAIKTNSNEQMERNIKFNSAYMLTINCGMFFNIFHSMAL